MREGQSPQKATTYQPITVIPTKRQRVEHHWLAMTSFFDTLKKR